MTCLGLADEDNSDDGNEVDDDDDDESDEYQEVIIAAKHLEKEVRKCLSLGQYVYDNAAPKRENFGIQI